MCFRSPSPPPLPKPEPRDSPIEPVASRIAVGDQRKQKSPVTGDNRTTMATPKEKKSKSGKESYRWQNSKGNSTKTIRY